jgi:hypothetical protein
MNLHHTRAVRGPASGGSDEFDVQVGADGLADLPGGEAGRFAR